MNKLSLLISALLLLTSTAAWPASFSGTWNWSAAPQSRTFSIDLKQNGKNIVGQYCAVALNGARVDCDDETNPNVHGEIDSSGKSATVQFYSFFNARQGRATMRLHKGRLIWKIMISPFGGDFYAPHDAILERN
jgi:hypothetical protein